VEHQKLARQTMFGREEARWGLRPFIARKADGIPMVEYLPLYWKRHQFKKATMRVYWLGSVEKGLTRY